MRRNPTSFVRFVDGVHDLRGIDSTHYEAVFETKVGYLKFKFNVTVEVTRAEEPSSLAICRCGACPEVLDTVRLASRKRKVRPSIEQLERLLRGVCCHGWVAP
jgi:hypothetical protein